MATAVNFVPPSSEAHLEDLKDLLKEVRSRKYCAQAEANDMESKEKEIQAAIDEINAAKSQTLAKE